jgi:hypothetical protein
LSGIKYLTAIELGTYFSGKAVSALKKAI